MEIDVITWNLFHGRDFPPDPALLTLRSRLLRTTERGDAHVQVNRDLFDEFAALLRSGRWEVALLQECPPRWGISLARACGAEMQRSLTARNWLGSIRSTLAGWNPDLLGAWEGGSNLSLFRGPLRHRGGERLKLVLRRWPERRTMAFARLGPLCAANLHASTDPRLAESDLSRAAETAVEWAGDAPLLLGGDFNLRPSETRIFDRLEERFGLGAPTAPESIDHLLVRGLEVVDPPRAWPPEEREVSCGGLALRLSDHAPVGARFRTRDERR